MSETATSSRRSIVWLLRIAAIVLVGWGVSGSVRGGMDQLSRHEWHVRPTWLILSGALYAIGLVPMGLYWRSVLAALGSPMPARAALRAYFLGHIGKYVPGKAMSVILRVATVRRWVPSMRFAILSTLIETLTMMSAGAAIAAVASAIALWPNYGVPLIALAMAVAAGAPTLPPVARYLGRVGLARNKLPATLAKSADANDPATPQTIALSKTITQPKNTTSDDDPFRRIDLRLLGGGWCSAGACWVFVALSLWATLRAIGVESISPVQHFPSLVAAVGFAVVAGFLSQLPAGLGVRDALLMQLLVPLCGEANALIAAVLMRLVWLVSELSTCGILYVGGRARDDAPEKRNSSSSKPM
ncbi:MAG: flippase-like domain-containing protein [Pirellulales bacterium]|nr:flippase-like domain-containing protein [Pirellulales bacterium]